MKLKLAKWCSIIPLFVYVLMIAAAELSAVFPETKSAYLFELVGAVSMFLSIFVVPFLAVLGFVFSLILIFQKDRKAIKFLVLSFVNIIISVLLKLVFWPIYYSYKDELF